MMSRLLGGFFLIATGIMCVGCNEDESPITPPPPPAQASYVGAGVCGQCHEQIYADYLVSGHSKPFYASKPLAQFPGDTECDRCHTSGYDPTGSNDDGQLGTWEQDGITCEGCHGPGSLHVASEDSSDIFINREDDYCWGCHDIYLSHPVQESGSTVRETMHPVLDCAPCHDPHISARLDFERSILKDCQDCHTSGKVGMTPGHAMNRSGTRLSH